MSTHDAPAAASEQQPTDTSAIDAGMDEGSFQNALTQAVAEIEAEEGTEDDNSPTPETQDDEEATEDQDVEDVEAPEDDESDEEDDEEDDGEDDEEGDADEDGDGDDQKLSKSAKERARLKRRAEEKVRKELTEQHSKEMQGVQSQLAEVTKTFSEHKETSLRIELAAESMLEQLEVYKQVVEGQIPPAQLQAQLNLVAKNHEIRTLKATSENVQQQQQAAQSAAVQQRQQASKAWVSKLEGMAEAADIQPRRFLFEVREAMMEDPKADAMKLAKQIVKRMSKKGRRRGASGDDTSRAPVRPLKGGNGSGSGGAPNHFDVSKHEIGSEGMRDTLKEWLQTEEIREAKSR